jgi:hypothetical protein
MKRANSISRIALGTFLGGALSILPACSQSYQNIPQEPSIIWSTGEPHEARAVGYNSEERLERKREFFYRGNKSRIVFFERQDSTNPQKWCVCGVSGTRDPDSDALLEALSQKLPKLTKALRENQPIGGICFQDSYSDMGRLDKVEISLPDGSREEYIPEQESFYNPSYPTLSPEKEKELERLKKLDERSDRNPLSGMGI